VDKKTSMYEKDDFIDVVDANGAPHPPIPKQWLGTEHAPGFKKAPKDGEKAVEIPAGEPTAEWTVPQLTAWAAAQEPPVELDGKTKKDDIVAIVVKPAS
jgi:hypothetical protein